MHIKPRISREALNPECAFIIQIGALDPRRPSLLSGQIEHIASGDRRLFSSHEELVAIINNFRIRH